MAAAEGNTNLMMREVNCLPQMCKVLLTASCLACPSDPIQFLKNTLVAFQGHDNLETVDWQKFVDYAGLCTRSALLKSKARYAGQNSRTEPFCQPEKALSCYKKNLTSSCFREWKKLILQRREQAAELALKMETAKTHLERTCQRSAVSKWQNWVKLHVRRRAAAIFRLQSLVNASRLKRILAAWLVVAKDSKREKYFKRLELSVSEISSKDQQTPQQTGKRVDGISVLPLHLSLKIFQCLGLRDWLNCAEVCCAWKSIIQSGALWSQINFSAGKDWITDNTVRQTLQSYRPFVTHLNLRGCPSLNWSSLEYISECRNLQELNVSEFLSISDAIVQRIAEGCPCLLYLNLSCTLVTNHSLKAIFRNCLSLQYLSLARCRRFTDEGFLYLTSGKGGRCLIHLNLSRCTQMTVNAFRYISAGCPSLREVVINDVPTLSDGCVLALLTRCRHLSSVSLLGCPHLSDVALKAIAEAANLTTFSIESNNQITDVGWYALCRNSQGLGRLHAADCPGMTDDGLKHVAILENLRSLDVSLCSRVSDAGIKCLTLGSSAHKLSSFSISQCSLITDLSVRRIARRLHNLHHLNLSYCERLTDSALEWLSGSSIQSLDLSGCGVQDQGLAALHRIHLKEIVLADCVNVTDDGIEKLCKNMRDLEHVDVSRCAVLTDAAIRAVSFSCRGLRTLRMSGCPKMTDMAVLYLTTRSQYLRELDMSDCILLTDRSLRYLKRVCPPLTSIIMTCCCSISRAAALKLQTRVSHWEYSNDNPSSWFDGEANQIAMSPKADDTWKMEENSVMSQKAGEPLG